MNKSQIVIVLFVIYGIAGLSAKTLRGGVDGTSTLIKSGQVYMTDTQKNYFQQTSTGYEEKHGNYWMRLTVCTGTNTGTDYAGRQKTFKYFLCPSYPANFDSDNNYCCGKNGNQTCCTMFERSSQDWNSRRRESNVNSFNGEIGDDSVFKLAIGVIIAIIVVPIVCIACCIGIGVCIFLKSRRPSQPSRPQGFRPVAANAPPGQTAAYPQQQQQQQQQQQYPMPQQQQYPMPQQQQYPMPQQQPYPMPQQQPNSDLPPRYSYPEQKQ